ncbi:MAG: hypothetical protein HKO62_05335 [Gammaproteobacteria bacterium]|nr:hypothetical protein [Gammaproteobacteria bacterium]
MVQVDIPWTYGVGASFAVVAQRYLGERFGGWREAFTSWPFLQLAAFALFVIGPFTAQLLWIYPDWQLMYALDGPPGPWAIVAAMFALPLAGVTGYGVAWALLRAGRHYLAFCQFLAGYFLMFFGLSYGWDGTGYQRLFSVSREALANWSWAEFTAWSQSAIAGTFNLHMLVIVPYLLFFASWWIARDSRPATGQWAVVGKLFLLVFVLTVGTAVGCAALLINLGGVTGGIAVAVLLLVMLQPRWGVFGRYHRWLFDPLRAV